MEADSDEANAKLTLALGSAGNVLAHMWLNLAISKLPTGKERDVTVRFSDVLARRMTPDQLAEALRRPGRRANY